jgi:membrane protease YdiL (CAAX protease family)
MVIWHFPGAKGTLAIAVVAALAGGLGYATGGSPEVWAAVTFVSLFVAGWLWSTMESYTQNS